MQKIKNTRIGLVFFKEKLERTRVRRNIQKMEYFQNIKINSFFLILTLILVILCKFNDCFIVKRSASPESNLQNLDSGMDKIIVNYDEYPVSL